MKIATAYDAFWFLSEHPKMRCREAALVSTKEAKTVKPGRGERIRTVKDEMPWVKGKTYLLREFTLTREAIKCNLDIFYTLVDERKRVNRNPAKNVFPECWLEFGPIRQAVSDGRLHLMHYHDIDLDCGAPSFDDALVKLAKLVRKHYGDIKAPTWTVRGR